MLKSRGRTYEVFVMKMEECPQVVDILEKVLCSFNKDYE
jgi:hypothetical protein